MPPLNWNPGSAIAWIHTFIATSAIHMEFKLRKTKEQVIEIARSMVSFARSLGCDDVEFSPEDAGRFAFQLAFSVFWNEFVKKSEILKC